MQQPPVLRYCGSVLRCYILRNSGTMLRYFTLYTKTFRCYIKVLHTKALRCHIKVVCTRCCGLPVFRIMCFVLFVCRAMPFSTCKGSVNRTFSTCGAWNDNIACKKKNDLWTNVMTIHVILCHIKKINNANILCVNMKTALHETNTIEYIQWY